MLPEHLIVEFWETVRIQLGMRFELSTESAAKAIALYREAMERHRVGDIVYHRDPEAVAETIALGWSEHKGFPDPETTSGTPTRS